jgi:outer membrane receptor protein involved in Fe transport
MSRINGSPPPHIAAILGWVLLALPSLSLAQSTGTIRGVVTGLDGAPLAGVTIAISSTTLSVQERATVTDTGGNFNVPSLPPGGDYEVRASFPGLVTVVYTGVVVASGRTVSLRIKMQSASTLEEKIEVRARADMIDIQNTTTESRFSSEFVELLPIRGRNYQDVLKLAPGVSDIDGDGNPNVHGARDTDVNTLLDGVSTTDPLTGKIGAQLNIEAIQEIEVKTAGATAEFGGAQGAFVNIITKSGGNEFQGTFKFFWRGSSLDGDGAGAADPTLHGGIGNTALQDLNFNDFMPFLSVGGPIVRDRAWYFLALEYIQIEDPVNALSGAFVRGVNQHRDFAKFTWQMSPDHRLAFSMNYDPQEFLNLGLNTFTREETGFTLEQGGLLLSLREMSILSPTAVLETAIAHFDGRPDLLGNLDPDTNGNGIRHIDRNENGFFEGTERDPGEDYDRDGVFDVFEDTITRNGVFETGEDRDGDRVLTKPQACEGVSREDIDCDGRVDNVNEDLNRNGRFDSGEVDLDSDGHLDLGIEDRNGNGVLDDTPFPNSVYPYGRLTPHAPDRDYSIDLVRGIVNGPYYESFSDQRTRQTLRQDLSVFVPDYEGSHDLKFGYILEREGFERTTEAYDISAPRDTGAPSCSRNLCVPIPGPHTTTLLLPTEVVVDSNADARSTGLYIQDVYKPTPNLSLGLGVRFDRETVTSTGYSQFNPAAERSLFNRLRALGGLEVGKDPYFGGNGDGIITRGITQDPIFSGAGDPSQMAAFILDPLLAAAPTRLTRHRSSINFLSPELGKLISIDNDAGALDPAALEQLGVLPQLPESFSLTNNNLSPRLAVSWDPWRDGRTKLFATWGRYYDKLFLSTVVGEEGPDRVQRYYSVDHTGLDFFQKTTLPGTSVAFIATPNHYIGDVISQSPPATTQISRNLQTPYSDEFTVGFEREVAPEMSLAIRYIDRHFREQLQDIDINHSLRTDPDTGALTDRYGSLIRVGNLVTPTPDGRPDLFIHNFFFNEILRVGNFNEARYKAIELEFLKRLSRRWQLQGSYTYSRAVGAAEDFQSRLGNDPSTVESEFGNLDYDQRHVVKLNAMSFLPRDWQVGFVASWSSGLPYSVVSRFFALDDTQYQQFRTRYGFTDTDLEFQTLNRNSERNQAVLDLNLQVKKSLVLGKTSAAIFVEVFNLLNSDDLRVFTFEPNRGFDESEQGCLQFCGQQGAGVDAQGLSGVSNVVQLDGERRFGRRWQVGIQFDF